MKNIRVGIVGCGGMGQLHSKYLKDTPGVEIAAGADKSDDVLKNFKENFPVKKTYTSYSEMYSSEELDIVLICLPTSLHRDAAVEAAENKINVFCEKPLARRVSEGEEIVEACKKNGVKLQVGFVRRFDNSWCKAKDVVESGVLGKPLVWRQASASLGPRLPWFLDRDIGGGVVMDKMAHDFDFGNFMFGKPVKVVSGLTKFKESSAIDTASVWIEYDSGNFASIFNSWGLPEKTMGFSGMDILGPKGVLAYPHSFDRSKFESAFDPEKQDIFLLTKEGGTEEPIPFEKNDLFQDQMKHLVDWVGNDKEPKVTGEDGLLSLRVAIAALQEGEL